MDQATYYYYFDTNHKPGSNDVIRNLLEDFVYYCPILIIDGTVIQLIIKIYYFSELAVYRQVL